ncbi:3-oxoacyl-[acyl-carrier-protein] synthase 1 [Buchnera aphidicola (Cinara kochiana kochiana)]|uniref:3-oxoacyl-[acyl-carrier-protein] synthase 1 n=1 Tax=Buchnera aphidicola (Cinara kochiana kochiana) TaxID=2518976 RepID=A0A451D558_9GAMM|nr:beta-ketoacyl synthase N-terminal-like domain-containing protein [Buchnera aphidicola]VFP80981.1 3-oxoacyl-[acyl-carrier-protein] synthase 1 [Buchnera aphidicola (Cinara kochiana kochiana)]
MKRTVITGFGIVSSIGTTTKNIVKLLKEGISGIIFSKKMKEYGLHSNVWGEVSSRRINQIPKNFLRFMNLESIYSYLSLQDAIKDSKLHPDIYMKNPRVGIIMGSGSGAAKLHTYFFKNKKNNGNKISPYSAIKNMPSSISACLGTFFKIYGINYSINSACSTSAHCIGNAYELISSGKQDIIFAGGGEELSIELARQFDAMRVLSIRFNKTPECSSRAFDKNRDGFVISGGGGVVILEELSFALSRNARIYAEIIGYGATCDGYSMVHPSGDGFVRCMNYATKNVKDSIDYINAHGTSTKIGDIKELDAIKKVFNGFSIPYISSTKSITGHSLGASGVQEIIYTMLMIKYNFIAPSINIDSLDPIAYNMNIVTKPINTVINMAISNSFGFGGTNASLVIKKFYK